MAIKLHIPGQPEIARSAAVRGLTPGDNAPTTNLLDDVEVVHAFSLSPSARAASAAKPADDVAAADDDILEVEVDGFKLWTSAKQYEEQLRTFRPEAIRPDGSVVVDRLPSSDVTTRGDGDRTASAVRVLRLKTRLEDLLENDEIKKEFFDDFGMRLVERAGSWVLAKAITWLIERQLRPREGVYEWTHVTRTPQAGAADPAPASFATFDVQQPILLFLHGTASSTRGSFGEFLADGSIDQWKELTSYFKDNIYAFEHKTLSRSPIENAIAVATKLPAQAKLYLVSHSRGGIVGDLLCLNGLDAGQVAAFTRHGEFDEADAYDRDNLQRLGRILAEKRFRVQRFARAACPARGTLLASENLDHFLSVVAYLVGLIPYLKASPLYDVIKRIALETAHRRWEPGMLPGLEAQTPTSPLVRLLNTTRDEASGELGVIAGDIQGGNWLKRFGVFLSDRAIYENRDNDLVVNTDSMFRGAARKTGRYVFDKGADVSHFNYFRNRRTRTRVSQWMTSPTVDALTDFRNLEEAKIEPVPMARERGVRAGASRPVVVLVPDLMGSDLHAGPEPVWIDYDALSAGGFGKLDDVSAATPVHTTALLGEPYKALSEYLANSHDVVPFAYDWRLSTKKAASALGDKLRTILAETTQPVRLLAHGMGGIVVRQLIASSDARATDDPWQLLTARDGGRAVLLGTPHGGSYDSVELLLGTHPVAQQIALLDPRLGPRGVIALLQTFPGVLELLPRSANPSFFDSETWRRFQAARRNVTLPDATLLGDAKGASDAANAAAANPGQICNVAGSAPRTVYGVEPRDRVVTLEVTTQGDGRVTYDSVQLKNVPTWYMETEHGELASNPRGFGAILDLLQLGDTKQLATVPPSLSRGGARERRTQPEQVLYPTRSDLITGAFGRGPRPDYRGKDQPGFRVSVVHGDLSFARFPIVVGHYEGDTIIGPESVVDRLFGRALTARYNLGLYPGALGTLSVVLPQATPLQQALQLPKGAIVVGLGRWGTLTAGQIANIVRRAALEYVLQLDDRSMPSEPGAGQAATAGAGLSILLIGATASNISTEDSVAAILRGVAQANLELEKFTGATTRITEIEIPELYVDTAIETARAARKMAVALSEELNVRIDAAPLLQRGRYGRVRYAAARNIDAWRRWEVTAERSSVNAPAVPERLRKWLDEFTRRDNPDPALLGALAGIALADPAEAPLDRLRFVSLSDRARAEVMMEQHQPTLVDRLIRSSVTTTGFNRDAARVLFELMVPNDLKDGLGQLSNVVFVLDGHTAAYPWELMTDGGDAPLFTRIKMVRQLQSATFRPHIRTTTGEAAYVVGDPRVTKPFQQLEGARAEAAAVADTLSKSAKFEPTLLPPEASAGDVLGGLFARPYRVVHLAGHGDYQPGGMNTAGERSGMVLEDGMFLTAAEVRKMSQVPELVFLNCCHIGQVGPEPVQGVRNVAYNRLAASISRELIEMGVRAVVAAGWAVRDDAALVFATAFYDEMLGGQTFGRALCTARQRTWSRFPDANTWGAYQAYGDPDFRLVTVNVPAEGVARVAPEELLEQIDKIWRQARRLGREREVTGGTREQERIDDATLGQIRQLNDLVKEIPSEWLNRSEVRVAIGEAYGELRAFEQAIEHLDAALDTGEANSKTTIKAAEQLLNFIARQAATERNEPRLRDAIARLESLLRVGSTSERYSLLAGAQKRLATLLTDAGQARPAIRAAAASYRSAFEHDRARKTFRYYPVVNWLALAVVDEMPKDVDWETLLRDAKMNAEECFIRDRSAKDAAFDAIALADISIVRALASGAFATDDAARTAAIDRIATLYQEAIRRTQATRRQVDSATDQLASLEGFLKVLAGEAPTEENRLTREALKQIRERVS